MDVTNILCVFGCFLYLRFSLACFVDSDCFYTGQHCCKYTETGKTFVSGICVWRTCVDGVCRTRDDCVPGKRCDTSSRFEFRCTRQCFVDDHCRQMHGPNWGHICSGNRCVLRTDRGGSDSTIDMKSDTVRFIFIASGVVGFCLIAACLRHIKRRGQINRGLNASNARPRGITSNVPRSGNVERSLERPEPLQLNATIQTHPAEESNSPTCDAIAKGGPPPYMEVGDVPECPPPTYEEATKA